MWLWLPEAGLEMLALSFSSEGLVAGEASISILSPESCFYRTSFLVCGPHWPGGSPFRGGEPSRVVPASGISPAGTSRPPPFLTLEESGWWCLDPLAAGLAGSWLRPLLAVSAIVALPTHLGRVPVSVSGAWLEQGISPGERGSQVLSCSPIRIGFGR